MFLGLGSYTVAILALHLGVNPFLLAPLGGITAVVVAVLIGSVVLRTRGHAFVIITIAMLLALQVLATNLRSLTKGSDGITLDLPFWSRDFQNIPFYYALLALLLLTVLFSAWIRRTKFGTGLVAIREDEGKAASIGVNTTRFKIVGYGASAFFIGVAGGVYAYYLTFLNPVGSFAILGSVTIVLAALAGGRGTLYGPVVGAFLVQAGQRGRHGLRRRQRVEGAGVRRRARAGRAVHAERPAAHDREGVAQAAPDRDRVHRPGGRAVAGTVVGARTCARRGRCRGAGRARGGRGAARRPRRQQALRRPGRRRPRRPAGAQGQHHRAHRSERLGQDDAVQPDHRRHVGRLG
ncbi:hypothetical protein GCM10025868_22660 [Angustibacter aerolatus]|uniref:Branched-chain amino acid ABC transporter permease n=1 Tax=Angustibacter aerolatus TaxID=1162965 RepID=A0ABQ6JHK2_9ACTN|nr:hypothetical protein GCM10025868_22660 [Angustibacter aerolatus]